MIYARNERYKKTAQRIIALFGFLFLLFTVVFLFRVQSDVIGAAQHVFSHGRFEYHPLLGSLTITILIMVLAHFVRRFSRLPLRFVSLAYFPSCLCLAFLSDICTSAIDGSISLSRWYWLWPAGLLFYVLFVGTVRRIKEIIGDMYRPFINYFFSNIIIITLLFTFVGGMERTTDSMRYALRVDKYVAKGDVEQALKVGDNSLASNRRLTYLRAYALSLSGRMGERLFEYPQYYHSNGLLPLPSDTAVFDISAQSVYRYIGIRPVLNQTPFSSLYILHDKGGIKKQPCIDYWLCGLLLDKKIDLFAREISQYYQLTDTLPKHYREALTLYNHLRTHPAVVYHNDVEEAHFNDFQSLCDQYKPRQMKDNYSRREYGGTYYWYFMFAR